MWGLARAESDGTHLEISLPRIRANFGQRRPTWVDLGRDNAPPKFGLNSGQSCRRVWPESDQSWPGFDQSRPTSSETSAPQSRHTSASVPEARGCRHTAPARNNGERGNRRHAASSRKAGAPSSSAGGDGRRPRSRTPKPSALFTGGGSTQHTSSGATRRAAAPIHGSGPPRRATAPRPAPPQTAPHAQDAPEVPEEDETEATLKARVKCEKFKRRTMVPMEASEAMETPKRPTPSTDEGKPGKYSPPVRKPIVGLCLGCAPTFDNSGRLAKAAMSELHEQLNVRGKRVKDFPPDRICTCAHGDGADKQSHRTPSPCWELATQIMPGEMSEPGAPQAHQRLLNRRIRPEVG